MLEFARSGPEVALGEPSLAPSGESPQGQDSATQKYVQEASREAGNRGAYFNAYGGGPGAPHHSFMRNSVLAKTMRQPAVHVADFGAREN